MTKCGTGFSDAELAALPARLAPLARPNRPARVDARQQPDVWFEPGLVLEILSAELTLSPTYTAGWGRSRKTPGWRCGSPVHRPMARRQVAEDATTIGELVDLYRTAQRKPAGGADGESFSWLTAETAAVSCGNFPGWRRAAVAALRAGRGHHDRCPG